MLIFLYGADSFRIHERLITLRSGFRKKYDPSGHQVESFLANQVTIEQIRTSLLTQGLFSQRRCIIYRDIFELPSKVIPVWIEAVTQSNHDSIIITTAEQLPKAKSDLKTTLQAANRTEEYSLLKSTSLTQWIQQRFTNYHVSVQPNAVTSLVASYGSDLWSMAHTIDQLSHFTTTVSAEVVQQFVPSPLDNNIFHLSDALAERNSKRALQLLHEQLASGANPFYILTMLARQLTILIQVKEPSAKLDQLHPYVLKKAQQHAQGFSLAHLLKLHQAVVHLDVQFKTSTVTPELLFDQFILQLT